MSFGYGPVAARERSSDMGLNKVGSLPSTVTGVDVQETGVGVLRQTVFTFTDFEVTMTDEAGVVAYGGKKFYEFPNGLIDILGAVSDLTVEKSGAGINADFDGDFGVGTATANNGATLTGTEQNVIPSTATPQASGGATTAKGVGLTSISTLTDSSSGTADGTIEALADLSTAGGNTYTDAAVNAKLAILRNWAADFAAKINALINSGVGRQAVRLDGTSSAPGLYLNALIDDGDQDGGGTLIFNGTICVSWINHGDK